jgi:hypothetical protein
LKSESVKIIYPCLKNGLGSLDFFYSQGWMPGIGDQKIQLFFQLFSGCLVEFENTLLESFGS